MKTISQRINEVFRFKEDSKINDNFNKIELWEWFDKNAEEGWSIELIDDGKNNKRTYNVYNEKNSGIACWNTVDGWEWNTMF